MKIYQIDAFTNIAFTGNPAAVCLLEEQKNDEWLLNVTKEMNLSETAFLLKENDGYRLRWFTPTVEENLCGHATLSAAHVLWENGLCEKDHTIKFYTRSGLLTAEYKDGWIELDFPVLPEEQVEIPAELADALGVEISYVGKSKFDYLVEVVSEDIVKNLKPDFALLSNIKARGIIVTSSDHTGQYDFVSRFFAPNDGITEDPVTGSAHCCLGPYWKKKLNKNTFMAFQSSSRGGVLKVELRDNRVKISGQAITVLKGEFL